MTHLQLNFRETFLQDWARYTIASIILCSVLFSFHDSKCVCISKFLGKGQKLYITDITESRVGLVYVYFMALIFFYSTQFGICS